MVGLMYYILTPIKNLGKHFSIYEPDAPDLISDFGVPGTECLSPTLYRWLQKNLSEVPSWGMKSVPSDNLEFHFDKKENGDIFVRNWLMKQNKFNKLIEVKVTPPNEGELFLKFMNNIEVSSKENVSNITYGWSSYLSREREINAHFFFKNKDDAALFRLTWG